MWGGRCRGKRREPWPAGAADGPRRLAGWRGNVAKAEAGPAPWAKALSASFFWIAGGSKPPSSPRPLPCFPPLASSPPLTPLHLAPASPTALCSCPPTPSPQPAPPAPQPAPSASPLSPLQPCCSPQITAAERGVSCWAARPSGGAGAARVEEEPTTFRFSPQPMSPLRSLSASAPVDPSALQLPLGQLGFSFLVWRP